MRGEVLRMLITNFMMCNNRKHKQVNIKTYTTTSDHKIQ